MIIKRPERFTETSADGEIILMRNDGEFISLPDTAATIWQLIDTERDHASLVAATARQYAVSEADIRDDVGEFLTELEELGLIDDG
jgi:hypothetical protein